MDLLEADPETSHENNQGIENSLRELQLFSLEETRLWGDLVVTFKYLMAAYRKAVEGLFYQGIQ